MFRRHSGPGFRGVGGISVMDLTCAQVASSVPSSGDMDIPVTDPDEDGDYDGGFDIVDVFVSIGNDGASKKGWFLFNGVTVPQGSVILSAYMVVTASADANNTVVNVTIVAADEDNAAKPTGVVDANSRPRTTASAAWNNVAAWSQNVQYQTPPLATVMQELVDRAGWAGDRVLMFVEDNGSTANAERKGHSYRGDPAKAAVLHVQYVAAVGRPIAPTGLLALPVSSTEIGLSWADRSSDETGFRVYHSTDGITFSAVGTCTAGSVTYNHTGLAEVTQHFYYVVAYNGTGESSPTNTASATTFATAPVAGSILWLKAGTGTYQDVAHTTLADEDGDVVGWWADQSGAGNNFTSVSDGTQRPTLQLNEVNGLPVVRGDGANDYLRSSGNMTLTNFTAFIVAVPKAGVAATSRFVYHHDGVDGWMFGNGDHPMSSFPGIELDGAMNVGQPVLLVGSRGGGAATLRINGVQSETLALVVPTTIDEIYLFADRVPSNWTAVDIAEVIIYNSALSAADVATTEGYLLARYEIATETAGARILWLKSDTDTYQDVAGTTPATADGDVVGLWKDQSGKGNDFTSVTDGTQRPTIQTNEVNALPIVYADGVDDYLRSVNRNWLKEFTLTLLVKPYERGVNLRWLYQHDGVNGFLIRPDDYQMIDHAGPAATVNGCLSTGVGNIITFERTSTAIVTRRDGQQIDSTALGSAPATIVDEIFMFVDKALANDTNAGIAELILRRGVSAAAVAQDEAYLAARYGVPLVAPVWTQLADMPGVLEQHGFCELNGLLYVAGGIVAGAGTESKKLWAYDPVADAWDATLADMPAAWQSGALNAVNGKLYFIGGYETTVPASFSQKVYEYDPALDSWSTKTNMPTAREDIGSGVVGGKICVFGGLMAPNVETDVMEVYDPAADTWDETKADLPVAKWSGDFGCVYGGKIYAVGSCAVYAGYPTLVVVTTVYEYDPALDSWSTKTACPEGHAYKEVVAVGANLYVVGGSVSPGNGTYTHSVWRYDVAADSWHYVGAAPNSVAGSALAAYGDEIYMSGGETAPVTQIDELWKLTP